MHRAVASALGRAREKLSVSIVGAKTDVAVLLAFSSSKPFPVWIAKVASNIHASSRLRAEHQALELIRPWAAELNVPLPLEWDEQSERSCLIFSGVNGFSEHFGFPSETGKVKDARQLAAALGWLKKFRERVPASAVEKELGGESRELARLEEEAAGSPELGRLREVLRSSGALGPLVASHGDFWCGNLLFEGPRLGVIDWEVLGARSRLRDVFSLLTNCSYLREGRVEMDVTPERFFMLYFSESTPARFVRDALADLRPSPAELRSAFYSFVASSLRMKGGRFRASWVEILRVLDERGFPEPWSVSIGGPVSR